MECKNLSPNLGSFRTGELLLHYGQGAVVSVFRNILPLSQVRRPVVVLNFVVDLNFLFTTERSVRYGDYIPCGEGWVRHTGSGDTITGVQSKWRPDE